MNASEAYTIASAVTDNRMQKDIDDILKLIEERAHMGVFKLEYATANQGEEYNAALSEFFTDLGYVVTQGPKAWLLYISWEKPQ